jgi:hypothetical protein
LPPEPYFGSVPVYLAQVPGTAIPYVHAEWAALREPAALEAVLARADKIISSIIEVLFVKVTMF